METKKYLESESDNSRQGCDDCGGNLEFRVDSKNNSDFLLVMHSGGSAGDTSYVCQDCKKVYKQNL